MSDALREILLDRADRTDPAVVGDPRTVLAAVRERVEQRRRTRRNAAAAGGGALLVAALVVGAVVLPSAGHHSGSAPVGGPGSAAAGSSGTAGPSATADSSGTAGPSGIAGRSITAGSSVTAAERSAVSAAASRVSVAASRAASRAAAVHTLVSATTPKEAAVAIGLVPEGWHYVGRTGPESFYGPTTMGPSNTPDFATVIVVDVHERVSSDSTGYDLTIGGRPARYGADSGVQVATVVIDATTELDVQLPVSAPVTRAQALRIAGSLDLRSKAEKTHG